MAWVGGANDDHDMELSPQLKLGDPRLLCFRWPIADAVVAAVDDAAAGGGTPASTKILSSWSSPSSPSASASAEVVAAATATAGEGEVALRAVKLCWIHDSTMRCSSWTGCNTTTLGDVVDDVVVRCNKGCWAGKGLLVGPGFGSTSGGVADSDDDADEAAVVEEGVVSSLSFGFA